MDTISLANKLSVYNPWGILSLGFHDSMNKLSNIGVAKEISLALAENIDRYFKIIMKSTDKKRKPTCEIKQTMKLAGP